MFGDKRPLLGLLLSLLLVQPSLGLANVGGVGGSEKLAPSENRELLEYLMQASSHAFSQLPPGYLYNSATEENQLELPVTSASTNLSAVGDETGGDGLSNGNSTTISSTTNYPNISKYLSGQLGHHHYYPNVHHQTSTTGGPSSVGHQLNLTRLAPSSDEDEASGYLLSMSNKQAKSSDFTGSPLGGYLHGHHMSPVHHATTKLYRMTGAGREAGAWGRREPLSAARTVSSLFGLPNRPRKAFGELKSIDLMKSADIPTEMELEYPVAQLSAAQSSAMRSFPLYHQASTYGQYYAAEDPRQAYYQQMRDYYGDPHSHDMAYSKSDFYWLIPIAFLIGKRGRTFVSEL